MSRHLFLQVAPRADPLGSQHAEGTALAASAPRAPGGAERRFVGTLGLARLAHPCSVPVGLGTVATPAPGPRPLGFSFPGNRGLFRRRCLQISPRGSAG